RSGTMTIAGQTFTVNQAGAASACNFMLNPVSKVFGRSGGSSTVSVTTSPGCAWTAVSNAPWITITGGASGSGSGVMSYTVSATTTTRTGTITIAGKTFTIKQSAF
ncbi:MAG TPA: BACON domain-containing carbohydrate-binding protein, partial [Blastocatellia bacterium]